MKIKEAKDQTIIKRFGNYRAFVEAECLARWEISANWEVNEQAPPLPLIVTFSNYAVLCECNEAFVVDWGEPYFCPNCLNAEWGGKARAVDYPKQKDRAEIERVLLKRIYPQNRNMRKGETIEDLKAENRKHGLED